MLFNFMVLNIDLELEDMIFSEKTSSNSYGLEASFFPAAIVGLFDDCFCAF